MHNSFVQQQRGFGSRDDESRKRESSALLLTSPNGKSLVQQKSPNPAAKKKRRTAPQVKYVSSRFMDSAVNRGRPAQGDAHPALNRSAMNSSSRSGTVLDVSRNPVVKRAGVSHARKLGEQSFVAPGDLGMAGSLGSSSRLNRTVVYDGTPRHRETRGNIGNDGGQSGAAAVDRATLLEQYRASKLARRNDRMNTSHHHTSMIARRANTSRINRSHMNMSLIDRRRVGHAVDDHAVDLVGDPLAFTRQMQLYEQQWEQQHQQQQPVVDQRESRSRISRSELRRGSMRSRSPSPIPDMPITTIDARPRRRSPSPSPYAASNINNQHDSLASKIRELNIMETILLQLCFMNAKAQAAFSRQEHKAMHQLYLGWVLLQQHKQNLGQDKFLLAQERMVQHIHSILIKQAPVFDNLMKHMTMFQQCYHTLATALNNTTHKLPTSGIAVDSFQQAETDLCNALQHSQTLLHNMRNQLQTYMHRVGDIHDTFQKLHAIVESSEREVEGCQESLAETRLMGEEEQSLVVNSVQQCRKRRQLTTLMEGHQDSQQDQRHEITLEEALGLLEV